MLVAHWPLETAYTAVTDEILSQDSNIWTKSVSVPRRTMIEALLKTTHCPIVAAVQLLGVLELLHGQMLTARSKNKNIFVCKVHQTNRRHQDPGSHGSAVEVRTTSPLQQKVMRLCVGLQRLCEAYLHSCRFGQIYWLAIVYLHARSL